MQNNVPVHCVNARLPDSETLLPNQPKLVDLEERFVALTAAYGGTNWSGRTAPLRDELGMIWGDWGSGSETGTLRSVLMRRPGAELDEIADYDAMQMRADLDSALARAQHDDLAAAYRVHGVAVHYVDVHAGLDADDTGRGDPCQARLDRACGRGALGCRRAR
jgi:hypothetical protein